MFAADNVASLEFVSGDSPVKIPIAPTPTATTPMIAARASLSSRRYDDVRCLPSMTRCLGPPAPCLRTTLTDKVSTVPCLLALERALCFWVGAPSLCVVAACFCSVVRCVWIAALCLPVVVLLCLPVVALCLPVVALCLP